jgi:predicted nucleotidyltransferase
MWSRNLRPHDEIVVAGVEGRSNLGHNRVMDKDRVVQTLRAHEPELRAAGVLHLRVFGSVAVGKPAPYSDVHLMADLDTSRKFSLLDMSGLENRLSDILKVKVDLTLSKSMREHVRRTADKEAVLAF